jgi:ABC-type transporter Mla subunit MlaD
MFNANEAASSFEAPRQQARDGITQAQQIIQQAQQAQQQSGTTATGPNDFTKRFVMRFLALSDASDAASAMGVDPSTSSNVGVQLLGSIGGSTDLLA